MQMLFKFLSHWPLWALRALGWLLGWAVWLVSARYRSQAAQSLSDAMASPTAAALGLGPSRRRQILRSARAEAGLLVSELPKIWCDPSVLDRLRVIGLEAAQAAAARGSGVVFLTPHLGAFELAPRLLARAVAPITVLYRPARKAAMERLLQALRPTPGVRAVPANGSGVRQMMRALRAGEAIGMLPDQVPTLGDGLWSESWGRPAYTMTLPLRLAESAGAALFWVVILRVPGGWEMRISAWSPSGETLEERVRDMNRACERLILQAPSQYLWAYNRHKQPVYRGQAGHRSVIAQSEAGA